MRSVLILLASSLTLLVHPVTPASGQESFGRFKGSLVASFLPDGRNLKLERPIGYIDSKGRHWDVPAGTVTEGASLPRIFWATHPPFTGKHRDAAVIAGQDAHDLHSVADHVGGALLAFESSSVHDGDNINAVNLVGGSKFPNFRNKAVDRPGVKRFVFGVEDKISLDDQNSQRGITG